MGEKSNSKKRFPLWKEFEKYDKERKEIFEKIRNGEEFRKDLRKHVDSGTSLGEKKECEELVKRRALFYISEGKSFSEGGIQDGIQNEIAKLLQEACPIENGKLTYETEKRSTEDVLKELINHKISDSYLNGKIDSFAYTYLKIGNNFEEYQIIIVIFPYGLESILVESDNRELCLIKKDGLISKYLKNLKNFKECYERLQKEFPSYIG